MIRLLAFLTAVVCCVGLIAGTYTAISGTGDEVTFTETVKFGDPAVMNGRTAAFGVQCGDHMLWNFTYRFGQEDSHDTEFLFTQDSIPDPVLWETEVLEVYVHSGTSMSTTGGDGFQAGGNGYGDMIRTVAALTPAGEELEMNLKMADYLDYHGLNFSIDYVTDQYFCQEYVDMFSIIGGYEVYDSRCYAAFSELFKFPVLDNQIATITVGKGETGGIWELYYSMEGEVHISVVNAATEEGIYCIPVYLESPDSATVIPGEYALGMGVYFIPWKPDETAYSTGMEGVTLDVDNARNIYPLRSDAVVHGLEVDEDAQTAWMLSLENGVYVLTRLDLAENRVLDRLELMAHNPEGQFRHPEWYSRNGLMVVCDRDQLALVTDGAEPRVEFIVPVGGASDGMYYFTQETGTMVYEDGVLFLADVPYYNSFLNVMAFDETGPLYWGEYACDLFECDKMGGSPYLRSHYMQTGLE